MRSKSSKPIENIKKICSDLGHLFEEMEKQDTEIKKTFQKKAEKESQKKQEFYEHLKQQIADLS